MRRPDPWRMSKLGSLRWRIVVLLVAVLATSIPMQVGGVSGAAANEFVGVAAAADGGHWTTRADGVVVAANGAPHLGDLAGRRLARPIVDMAATVSGRGYWLVASDGGIFSFGDARFYGSTGAMRLNQPIVGIAPTPSGRGYWLVASDGGIFSFGDARFYGSTGAMRLNQPVVGMAATASGGGYWLVASDGGIFTFGNAGFSGSTGNRRLNQPVIGMAASPAGGGYWLVAADGGVFSFGDASFYGAASAGGANTVKGLARLPRGGYLLVAASGAVLAFGPGASTVGEPVVPPAPGAPAPAPASGPGPTGGTAAPTSPPSPSPGTTAAPSCPADAVRVSPGTSIQGLVDTRPGATVFCIAAGLHRNQQVRPKDGNTFVGEPGAILDGGGTTKYAFHGVARDVTIRNLVIQRYANPNQNGAVHGQEGDDYTRRSDGWLVEGNDIRDNFGMGVRIGDRMIVRNNRLNSNGQLGIGGVGDGVLVEGNEIAYNNTRGVDAQWEAGGSKFVMTRDLVVRGNYVHNNRGPGLWTDIDNIGTIYEGNVVEYNDEYGIYHEISYRAIIRNNRVVGNGVVPLGWVLRSGIAIAASPDVEVYGNVLEGNRNGIVAFQQARGAGAYGEHLVRNLNVYDNTVIDSGYSGVAQDNGDRSVFTTGNNRFEGNTYVGGRFAWADGERSWSEWRSYGNDTTGAAT